MKYQMRAKDLKPVKAEWIKLQNGLCGCCHVDLSTIESRFICLDHCHETGAVRGVLCNGCNSTEGRMRRMYVRSGFLGKIDFAEWLQHLSTYLVQDSSDNPLHPQHVLDQVKKFKSLNKFEQEQKLISLGVAFDEKATKTDLTKNFQIHLKSFTK